jgi:RimJ/RimL family protein N-acetyltransferase
VRLPVAHDAEALVIFGDDPDVAETIWIPIPTPCSRKQAAEGLAEFERGWHEESRFGPTLVIADGTSDVMVGVVFLRMREHASIELSYGVAAGSRNRGIATAALVLVSRWCLDELRVGLVELRIGADNRASQRVAAKAGFAYEGIVQSQVAATGHTYDDFRYTLR